MAAFSSHVVFAADSTAITVASAAGVTATSVSQSVSPTRISTSPTSHNAFRNWSMAVLNRSGKRPVTKFGLEIYDSADSLAAANIIPVSTVAASNTADRPLVVLVHGFNSKPERMTALEKTIHEAGFACGALRYPNDQPIADSALLLSQELRRLAKQQPDRKIALVTHSMGGLVARECIENPALDPGNVVQLIEISPPSQGTSCAYLPCTGDLWEHCIHSDDHNVLNCLYASLEDGMGEASVDMQPGSAFLTRLNSRPRNPQVRYTIFLGTGTPYTGERLAETHRLVEKCGQADRFIAEIEPALDRMLDGFSDCAAPGDGVVSLARGQLDGVSDSVQLGFDHWNAIREPNCPAVSKLQQEIIDRLVANSPRRLATAARGDASSAAPSMASAAAISTSNGAVGVANDRLAPVNTH